MRMVLGFDPRATAAALGRGGRRRLIEIARAEKALPWTAIDDDLAALMLVSRYTGVCADPLANIAARGWQVLAAMARQTR